MVMAQLDEPAFGPWPGRSGAGARRRYEASNRGPHPAVASWHAAAAQRRPSAHPGPLRALLAPAFVTASGAVTRSL